MKNNLPRVLAAIEARTFGLWDVPAKVFFPINYVGKAKSYHDDLGFYEENFYHSAQFPTRYDDAYVHEAETLAVFRLRAHNFRNHLRKNEVSCGNTYTHPQHLEGRTYA